MTTVDEPASRPLRKDAARNRALLLQAAREVFAERGLDASLDDIAKQAGVGVGTAYRHFANKYELAEAIFAEAIEDFVTMAERAADQPDAWAGLVGFLEAAADAQTRDRGLRELMTGFHDPDKMEEVNDRMTAPLRKLVVRAKQAGDLRAEVEVSDIGIVVMMLCTVADVTGDVTPELWKRYLPMLLDGLRSDTELPVPAMSEDALRTAMAGHKQRMADLSRHGGRPGGC